VLTDRLHVPVAAERGAKVGAWAQHGLAIRARHIKPNFCLEKANSGVGRVLTFGPSLPNRGAPRHGGRTGVRVDEKPTLAEENRR
jgi:hypothetical protein